MSENGSQLLKLDNTSYDAITALSTNYYSDVSGFLKFKNAPEYLANDINGADDAIGATIYIINERYQIKYATNLFYLTGFSFNLKERAQVTNSLKEPIIAFFDESVRVYTFQGAAPEAASSDLLNTSRNFQHSSLVHMYNNYLRGTELVKNKHIAVLKVSNHTVYGYPLNLSSSLNSGQDKIATFAMNWAVARHTLDLPGIVNKEDLEGMITVPLNNRQDLSLFLDYLQSYVYTYLFALNTSNSYLKNKFELSSLTSISDNLSELYNELINRKILKSNGMFLINLTTSINIITTAKSVGMWNEHQDSAEFIIEQLRQYLRDVQEGRGILQDG